MNISIEEISRIVAPLDAILSDPDVWDILIDHHQRVMVWRKGSLEEVESPFATPEALRRLVDDLFGLYGITLGPEQPIAEISLPDHTRCIAVVPPVASSGEPALTLRRIIGGLLTWEQAIEYGSASAEVRDLLAATIAAKKSILVTGGLASGKTTLSRLIAELAPPEYRVIVAEAVFEMPVEHPRALHLQAGNPSAATFDDLLKTAATMRPDWLAVGAVQGPEAAQMLGIFSSVSPGQALLHGTSVEDALNRLEAMVMQANLGLGLPEIRNLVAAGLNLIVQIAQYPNGKRRVVEIAELRGLENQRYALQPLMRYHAEADTIDATGAAPSWQA